jgi:hypothetical protein
MEAETDKRYEVVVKHYKNGVLHRAFFDDSDAAKRWLLRRWAALPIHLDIVDILRRGDIRPVRFPEAHFHTWRRLFG